jgi:hypothetical protein
VFSPVAIIESLCHSQINELCEMNGSCVEKNPNLKNKAVPRGPIILPKN